MRKHRFFTSESLKIGESAVLGPEDTHKIYQVLRLKAGDTLFLFNNSGQEYQATIKSILRNKTSVNITHSFPDKYESPLRINLAQAILAGQRMDFIIQKATELGAQSITPIFSERTIVKPNKNKPLNKIEHWQKIAINASCQCSRNYVPIIHTPLKLEDWLNKQKSPHRFIFSTKGERKRFRDLPDISEATILIGPEGGFAESELIQALSNNFVPLNLGPRYLRTETAAIAAIANLQAFFGDA